MTLPVTMLGHHAAPATRCQPDVVRLAPVALYTSHHDLWRTVQALKEIIDARDYERVASAGPVT